MFNSKPRRAAVATVAIATLPLGTATPADASPPRSSSTPVSEKDGCSVSPLLPEDDRLDYYGHANVKYHLRVSCARGRYVTIEQAQWANIPGADQLIADAVMSYRDHLDEVGTYTVSTLGKLPHTQPNHEEVYQKVRFAVTRVNADHTAFEGRWTSWTRSATESIDHR